MDVDVDGDGGRWFGGAGFAVGGTAPVLAAAGLVLWTVMLVAATGIFLAVLEFPAPAPLGG